MLGVSIRHSPHHHTGRLRPHRESSYGLLIFLVLCLGVLLASISIGASARNSGPQTGSLVVNAVVSGPRPASPATISAPSNGQTFDANPITVSGSCPAKSLVKIYTNGIFVGSILCDKSNRFSLQVDLVIGKNVLTAVPYNALDQAGPDSAGVNLTLSFPGGGLGFSQQLLLQSSNYYRGTLPGVEISWPLEIVGGVSPFAVTFDWGDGKTDLLTRPQAGPFDLRHTYAKAGGYLGSFPLIVKATDAAGNHAYIQLTTIVNDPHAVAGATSKPTSGLPNFKLIWPLWIVLLLMIASFWYGEKREKHILERRMLAMA